MVVKYRGQRKGSTINCRGQRVGFRMQRAEEREYNKLWGPVRGVCGVECVCWGEGAMRGRKSVKNKVGKSFKGVGFCNGGDSAWLLNTDGRGKIVQ